MESGQFFAGEYKRIKKDGSEVWINASYNPIFDDKGNPYKVVKFATDVTEQKMKNADYEGKINAISKAQAIIEFNLDGTIITANDNFLNAMGYSLDEIKGKHHRIFCEEEYTKTPEYQQFWTQLGRGNFDTGEYKRFSKDGSEIWINASYNPILDASGNVYKVVKFATDITEQKVKSAEFEGKINAINISQAVIEFNLDGTIITANDNFLNAMGYSLDEIKGKHHRIFCEEEYTRTPDYQQFWTKLGKGEFDAGEYKRVGKEDKEVWINASYNPILNADGEVYKVVKFATDLTKEKMAYNNLVNTFEQAAGELFKTSDAISQTAGSMSQDAEKTLEVSKLAESESGEVSSRVQNVSTSTEELNASIQELTVSSSKASTFSSDAKEKTSQASLTINELGDASESIGNIIKVISSITQQTNLLALNATIEAARAGEAGKGFAVVANEVKELAKQTAVATEDIAQKIVNVQESTKSAISSVDQVTGIIDELNAIASTTAAAVEQQSATTSEVSKMLSESNSSVEKISEVITEVTESAMKNSSGAKEMLQTADQVEKLSSNLQQLIQEAKAS